MTDELLDSESYNRTSVASSSEGKLWRASYGDLPASLVSKYGANTVDNQSNPASFPLDSNGRLMPSPFGPDHNSSPAFTVPLSNNPSSDTDDHSWRDYAEKHSNNLGLLNGEQTTASTSKDHLDPNVRAQIDDCFHLRTNMDGFVQTGGYIGGISGLASWGLDQYYKNLPPDERFHKMGWWPPLSPMLRKEQGQQDQIDKNVAARAANDDKILQAESALKNSSRALLDWQTKLHGELECATTRGEWQEVFERQSTFVNESLAKIKNQQQLKQFFDSEAQVLKGNAVFIEGSEESKRVLEYRAAVRAGNMEKAAAIKDELSEMIRNNFESATLLHQESAEQAKLLQKKIDFSGKLDNIQDPAKIEEHLGSASEVETGAKLFVRDSTEAKLLLEHAEAFNKHKSLMEAAKLGASELSMLEATLSKQIEKGAGSWVDAAFRGAGRGLFATGSAIAIGYCFDKALGHNGQVDSFHLISDGFVLPAILSSGLAARVKIPAALATTAVSRLADFGNKHAGSADFGSFMRPNLVDAFGATAIGLSSLPLTQKFAAGIGVLTMGRVYNNLAETFDWNGAKIGGLQQNADSAFAHDHETKSAESFRNAVDKEKEMGLQLDDAIRAKRDDWAAKENMMNRADYLRGEAILFSAIGQARLESGSRLNPNNHDMSTSHVLKSHKYDFGGQATHDLRTAAGALEQAQEHVRSQPWTSSSSQNVYVMQLKDMQAEVESKLGTIYGAHDIESIYGELQKVSFTDLLHAMARTRDQLMVCNTTDRRYIAKLARDLALGDLVNAARPNADSTYIAEAQKCLRISEQLDPSAPDNSALTMIANRFDLPDSRSVRF